MYYTVVFIYLSGYSFIESHIYIYIYIYIKFLLAKIKFSIHYLQNKIKTFWITFPTTSQSSTVFNSSNVNIFNITYKLEIRYLIILPTNYLSVWYLGD